MAGYNFEMEYACGTDNKVADALSRVGRQLDEEAVKELLDQGAIKELLNHTVRYGIPRADADDPRVVQEHEKARGRDHHTGTNAGRNQEELSELS